MATRPSPSTSCMPSLQQVAKPPNAHAPPQESQPYGLQSRGAAGAGAELSLPLQCAACGHPPGTVRSCIPGAGSMGPTVTTIGLGLPLVCGYKLPLPALGYGRLPALAGSPGTRLVPHLLTAWWGRSSDLPAFAGLKTRATTNAETTRATSTLATSCESRPVPAARQAQIHHPRLLSVSIPRDRVR